MKFLKIFLSLMFILALAACSDKKDSVYEYPDESGSKKAGIGEPCTKNGDCKDGLYCLDKVCTERSDKDEDTDDNDDTDSEHGDEDTDSADTDDTDSGHGDTDTDTDTDTSDSGDSDTDTDTSDSDDTDTDTQEYFPECGNGMRDPGEECDNGLENSDEPGIVGITCRTDCLYARCRDGIVDNNEICDDGNSLSGDYCNPDCSAITGRCGDGTRQINEFCDPGLDAYCSDDCTKITGSCGDGITQANEKCDKAEPVEGSDPGVIGPYYCGIDCQEIIGSCGDGERQINEACDDKTNNGRYGYCNSTCSGKGPRCGDGNIDAGHEICDDGNTSNGDYCSADCQTSYGACGDGIHQEDIEACDNATYNQGIGKYCDEDCQTRYGACGDSILQRETCSGGETNCVEIPGSGLNEECDNGALNSDDATCPYGVAQCTACSSECKKIPGQARYCGDGIISTGEVCDKATFGAGTGPYYCSSDCKEVIGWCGDGEKQQNEACDPGIDPYCNSNCTKSEGRCGDGIPNGNEQCDEGENNGNLNCDYGVESCTVCKTDCTTMAGTTHKCGDSTVDSPYETCDDGTENGSYGKCRQDCSGLGSHCGDGNIDSEYGEECDNAENNASTECPYGNETCPVCTANCKNDTVPGTWCGDGIKNGNEACDDGINDGQYGHCGVNCYDKDQYCGDGIQNGGEACDDGVNDGSYGSCLSDCSDFGPRCGDGIKNGNETCDDGENNGHYSDRIDDFRGYCNSNCNGYGEGGFCGDGIQNGDEACDEGSDNGQIPCAYNERSCEVCSTRCRLVPGNTSYCGDGRRDPNYEFCDDGANNGNYNAKCNEKCSEVPPKCGDGVILRENCEGYSNCVVIEGMHINEECDDGENNGKYYFMKPGRCNSDCQGNGLGGWCGDGIVNGYETCDDNELINGSYGGNCNARCNGYTAKCGDRILQRADCTGYEDKDCVEVEGANEECDEGSTLNGTYGHCNSDCSAISECGDGIVQDEEVCDDSGNNGKYSPTSQPYCNSNCQGEGEGGWCGDETLQPGEACDSGTNNGNYGYCNSDCSAPMPKCGDEVILRENCEGYSNCVVIEGMHINEECDDGTENGQYGKCNLDCSAISECGDGILQLPYESCDANKLINGTYGNCNSTCTGITGACNDGILQKEVGTCGGEEGCFEIPGANEECDNGSANGNTACPYGEKTCQVCTRQCILASGTETSFCGDKNINSEYGEACDDGEEFNGTFGYCDDNCREIITWKCGDNNVDFLHDEICDDGEESNGTYQMSSPGHCNSDCKGNGEGGYCGDGKVQKASEDHCGSLPVCSETLTTNCCEIVQFAAGAVEEKCDDGGNNGTQGYCNLTCDAPTPVCGNGTVEVGEACDDGEGNNGKYGKCRTDCLGSTGYCGDGKVQKASNGECELLSIPVCDGNTTENCCEVADFAEGDSPETCDEGKNANGYHDHCNETCSGISSCGDGEIGKDEICEPGAMAEALPCYLFRQFSGGTISQCNDECMPVLTDCVNADSYTIPYFDTKQTLCYDNSVSITCPAQNEAFYGQSPQFTYLTQNYTVGDETVSESVSGLTWQKETPAAYEGCTAEVSCTLEEAIAYCKNSSFGGYNRWRLPSAFEFPVIADFEAVPHMYSGFTGTKNDIYWTSEGLAFSTVNSTMTGGHTTAQVKCVRYENEPCKDCDDSPLVFQYSDLLITLSDNETIAVIWYFGNPKTQDNWQNALAFCKGLDTNGLNRMRLPTANELISLIDSKTGGSRIQGFTGRAWTSTTLSGSTENTSKAYVVDFQTLSLITDDKVNSNYVICVE